jgi:hypothetical protein
MGEARAFEPASPKAPQNPELPCHATVIERSVEFLNSAGAVERGIL